MFSTSFSRKTRDNAEDKLQEDCVDWLRRNYPGVPHMCGMTGALLRGGPRGWNKLCKRGASAGFPDLFIFVAKYPAHGMAVEFKRAGAPGKRRGRLSGAQKAWLHSLETHGYATVVVRDLQTFCQIVEEHLANEVRVCAA